MDRFQPLLKGSCRRYSSPDWLELVNRLQLVPGPHEIDDWFEGSE